MNLPFMPRGASVNAALSALGRMPAVTVSRGVDLVLGRYDRAPPAPCRYDDAQSSMGAHFTLAIYYRSLGVYLRTP